MELHQVQKIYFSQIEFLEYFKNENKLKIGEDILSLSKEIIVKIPNNLNVNTENIVDIDELKLSKEFISISSNSKYIDNKTSIIFSIILFIITTLFLTKTVVNYQTIDEYKKKIDYIQTAENNSLSKIQIKSIVKKYDKIYADQIKMRKLIAYLLNIQTKVNIKFQSIKYENKKLIIKMINNPKDTTLSSKIGSYIQKKYKNYKVKIVNNDLLVEVKI